MDAGSGATPGGINPSKQGMGSPTYQWANPVDLKLATKQVAQQWRPALSASWGTSPVAAQVLGLRGLQWQGQTPSLSLSFL